MTENNIPEGWKENKVESIIEILASKVAEIPSKNYKKEGKFPIIDQGHDFISGFSNENEGLYNKKLPVIIFGDHTRILKYVDFPFLVGASGTKILSVINEQEYDTKFFYYALQRIKIPNKSGGYARHSAELLKENMLYPESPNERKAIAIIFSTIDLLIKNIGDKISTTEKIKRGLIKYYFLNTHWESKKIEDICQVKTGGTPFTKNKEFWGGEIKWMSSGEIHNKFVYDTEKKITQKGLENSNAEILPINSIMIALNGQGKTRGTVAILKVETSCNQSLACLITNDKIIHYEYLYYNLQSRYNEIRNITGQKGREGLNLKTIKNIEIPIPYLENSEKSLNEQIKISSNLLLTDKKIEILNSKRTTLERIKKGLMNDLLSGKKRVNVENVLRIGAN